jgi:hypothetical protein
MPPAQKKPSEKSNKKPFSKFSLDDAYRALNLRRLQPWELTVEPIAPSDIFQNYLQRLQQNFDLQRSEESKKLIIDLIFVETIGPFPDLKIWKSGRLESDIAQGAADYLITENLGYIAKPMLCVVEAKKDDFEQGLAQCLIEMYACQWNNRRTDLTIDVLGIVSNGTTWQFYRLTNAGVVYETPAYSIGDLELLLGRLRYVFQCCENNLHL